MLLTALTNLANSAAVHKGVDSVSAGVSSIDWTKPTWDLFIVLFFVVAAFLYGLSLGRDRIVVILVSIYMALAVVNSAPEQIVFSGFAFRISTFLGLFVILVFLLSRSALMRALAPADNKGPWWQVIVFSVLHVGLLISVTLSFLPKSSLNQLTVMTKTLFLSDTAKFLWIVAPILFMVLLRGKQKEKKYKYEI